MCVYIYIYIYTYIHTHIHKRLYTLYLNIINAAPRSESPLRRRFLVWKLPLLAASGLAAPLLKRMFRSQ